ncbi:PTS fructose transporter subunit IIC [Ethanoligenens harbinense]|uniref:PTS system, fructose subfamily, IIC subunit n=1 Tax=Ethanoligenens harbinense (strain DSM 18485 / JCM 12961 / CGMCC 1.5033 / YUAN-3) TaxID=663278 RepID=E6U9F4_ETHHY|nr:PTS fructose transporter subunit IIBC [Ethanoligenens harbinense]ADU26145.1 PTS system, fructose subfamily, IIC subunit [Ethanoligenens harbinense YUAN-3]AVQ95288.1 PTS fructose transporter subunit IIBC [Ethanoligenens harbinense YUAN-3]AYF37952.1 PTS fructose transporter subunit IIBC [Ethanoligenens harbinense]AYF40699.1 PTS fructose transporter subunit IIBC [Ethanoligenens harbinense]
MKIIGVTKCPTGIAHTYMAAEKLARAAKELSYDAKIETQGASGTENKLTDADIKEADYVIIAADVTIDGKERFAGKKLLELPIKPVIKDPVGILKSLETEAKVYAEKSVDSPAKSNAAGGSAVIKQLMNGVSHMIPFVVIGGLFIATSLAFGGHATSSGLVISSPFWQKVNAIGGISFNYLMYPILAGFIAFAISGRAALAPAMVCALVANDKTILGTNAGMGFLGAILVGYLAGYLVKWFNSWKVPKSIQPIMPIFVIPILGIGIISAALILVLGAPISWLMTALQHVLKLLSLNPSTSIVLGLLLGAMVGVDMGGPINKVAFLFGVASITSGNPQIMGAVACAIPVPPLSMGLATLIGKKYFDEDEQTAGIPALLMGLIGITEGAIPFASADPKRALPSVIIGSSIAGAVGMLFGITDVVPHGGPIIGILGATNNIALFFLTIAAGSVIAALLAVFLKSRYFKAQAKGE